MNSPSPVPAPLAACHAAIWVHDVLTAAGPQVLGGTEGRHGGKEADHARTDPGHGITLMFRDDAEGKRPYPRPE